MCPSEHLHTAVSPGTSAGLEVSIRRTVTLSPQLSHVNPRHKKFGIGLPIHLAFCSLDESVSQSLTAYALCCRLTGVGCGSRFSSRVECEFQFCRKLLKFPGVSLSGSFVRNFAP